MTSKHTYSSAFNKTAQDYSQPIVGPRFKQSFNSNETQKQIDAIMAQEQKLLFPNKKRKSQTSIRNTDSPLPTLKNNIDYLSK